MLGRFGIGFAFAFALLVEFAFLAFAQHREIHVYTITSGRIRQCSATIKQHRDELRVALQNV